MQQMPPLPVRLNVELANNFLPKAMANGVPQMPYMAAPMHGKRIWSSMQPAKMAQTWACDHAAPLAVLSERACSLSCSWKEPVQCCLCAVLRVLKLPCMQACRPCLLRASRARQPCSRPPCPMLRPLCRLPALQLPT